MSQTFTDDHRDKLRKISTASLATCLFKRGLCNQFVQDVGLINSGAPCMVGEAYTLRYIPAREGLNPIAVFEDREDPQRKAVEEIPPGDIMVGDGVICLSAHLACEIAKLAFEMTAYEDFVEEQVSAGRWNFGLYPASPESRTEFEAWRQENER